MSAERADRHAWSAERAEAHLASLELFGMRLGLERMGRLLAGLGSPQRAYRAIHVVGTNGKSSTARYAAALLEAEGVRAGAYLSPHLLRWAERIRIGSEDLAPEAFGAAVQRTSEVAAQLDAEAAPDDRVTQFELMTATALSAFACAGVEVAVVEAGLGGRLDATNVLASEVTVLTSVALEHTEHLGGTLAEIAREKLAVLRPGTVLVTGPLPAEAEAEAAASAHRSAARRVEVLEAAAGSARAPAGYQGRNLALAAAAVETVLARPLDPAGVALVGTGVSIPGRLHVASREPLTLLDGAHNPAGMEALVAALAETTEGRRPLVGVLSVLAGKDAGAMLATLGPQLDGLVLTRCTNPRALAPEALAELAATRPDRVAEAGAPPSRPPTELVGDPHLALARARAMAGPGGAVVATGSIHLVADLLAPEGSRAATAY